MYIFPLAIVILASLALTMRRNGVGSFVTLGVFGAAVYSIPALVNTQLSLASRAVKFSNVGFISVAPRVQAVVLLAWIALLAGLIICLAMFPTGKRAPETPDSAGMMKSVALASALLGILGMAYLAYVQEDLFFFLQPREEQNIGAIATLWRWTPTIGLVGALFAANRPLQIFHGLVIFIIFLSGDRTLVAISTATVIAAASYRDPTWWRRLRPMQIASLAFAVSVVLLGKTIYISAKSAATGVGGNRFEYSLKFQLLNQFEPMATFSHLEFVMRTGLSIGMMDFFKSVAGNILLVPSLFGISTNLYNVVVTSKLSGTSQSGIAGNFLAHGYVVGGTAGAALFYFFLPFLLTLCDSQFRRRSGSVKAFWCCVGAVIAFYIHRNGLDNEFSFVRQIFIVSFLTAIVAAGIRQLTPRAPSTAGITTASMHPRATDEQFGLTRTSRFTSESR